MWLPWVAPLAVTLTAISTSLLVHLGPEARRISNPPGLWPDVARYAVSEPTDRVVLLVWWCLPIALVFMGIWLGPLLQRNAVSKTTTGILAALTTAAVAVIAVGLIAPPGETQWWRGIGGTGIVGGVALAVGIAWSAVAARWLRVAISIIILGVSAAWLLPALISTPDHIRDPYHFMFTGDELAAPAIGALPIGDFAAQYTNLLGYPIAPILLLVPKSATAVVVAWIVVLQLIAIAAVIMTAVIVGGRRLIPAAVALVAAPLVMVGTDSAATPLSYYATVPLRVVLPAVLILVLVWIARKQASLTVGSAVALGLGAGITALNNADFGGPALIAVFVSVLLLAPNLRARVRTALAFLIGAAAVPLAYAVALMLAGREVDPSAYLIFARVFGVNGFYQVAMAPFGLHVLAAALFITAAATGAWRLLGRRGSRAEATFIFSAGLWALLTLTYFAGRSALPTLVGGAAFQVGIVAVAMLPSALRALNSIRTHREPNAVVSAVMAFIMLAGILALMFSGRTPKDSLVDAIDGWSGRPTARHASVTSPAGSPDANTVFLLRQGALAELELGWKSALVINNPEAFMISPAFTSRQCTALASRPWRELVVEADIAPYLERDPACRAVIDFAQATSQGAVLRIPPRS